MLLALAAYSFRDSFGPAKEGRAGGGRRIDMLQFLDYCAEHDCAAEVTSYYFPADVDSAYLLELKRHAFLRGVQLSGTAVGNTFTVADSARREKEIRSVKQWVDRAAVMGAPHIRVFAGNTDGDKNESKKRCIAALEECGEYAGSKGVMLGIENHGGIVAEADDLVDIVRAVKSPWIGVNLDTGNFHTADPYADLEKCAPYAVNVQFKSEVSARGKKKEPADLGRVLEILRKANYQGYVALEYEAAEDPWKAVPPLLERMAKAMQR